MEEAQEPKVRKPRKPSVRRGKAVITASAGSKRDIAKDKTGTHKDPEIKVEEPLPLRVIDGDYSKVGVGLGMTRALGNYEFARVDVYVEDFCAVDKKQDIFESLHKEATAMVSKVVKDIDKFLEDKRRRDSSGREPVV